MITVIGGWPSGCLGDILPLEMFLVLHEITQWFEDEYKDSNLEVFINGPVITIRMGDHNRLLKITSRRWCSCHDHWQKLEIGVGSVGVGDVCISFCSSLKMGHFHSEFLVSLCDPASLDKIKTFLSKRLLEVAYGTFG